MPNEVPAWITGASYAGDPRLAGVTLPANVTFDLIAQASTDFLFEATGERFPGVRQDTIRPHRTVWACNFFGPGVGYDPGGLGVGAWFTRWFPQGWQAMVNPYELQLPMGPVVSVDAVTVDGVSLGGKGQGWDLYDHRRLVRLPDPVTGALLPWPWDQLLSTPVTQPGSWSVMFTHGPGVPALGVLACRELCIQTATQVSNQPNRPPGKTTRITRQDVTVDIVNATGYLEKGMTGYEQVDKFLAAYPRRRRVTIMSPDVPLGAVV